MWNIGAWRWMYNPFCRRSGRNSSAESSPAEVTPHLVAELGDALVEQALVVFVVLVHMGSLCRMRGFGPGGAAFCSAAAQCAISSADQHQHRRQDRAQDAVGYLGGNVAAEPDAGQRTDQQAAQQQPVDAAEKPVADAGDRGQR